MALTNYPVGNALAVSLWAKKLSVEALRQTYFYQFMGRGGDNMVTYRDDLGADAGDNVTFGLRVQLTGAGVQGDGTLEGNEEALTTYTDNLKIDQLRHAVRSAGKMSEQRVSVRGSRRSQVRPSRLVGRSLRHLPVQPDLRLHGADRHPVHRQQRDCAPDTSHIFRPNSRTTDESLTTGDEFNLAIIDRMVARANQFNNAAGTGTPMRPMKAQGRRLFVLFVHDDQVYQLRSSAAAGTWVDYQKAAIQGGDKENPLFTGGDLVGEYNGVLLHRAPRITNGVNSTTGAAVANTRRAVMVGAQAAMFATGRDFDAGQADKFTWVEEAFDYGNQLGVSAGAIFGLKKTRLQFEGFRTFVAATYTPAA
jgi:hypothetical protein